MKPSVIIYIPQLIIHGIDHRALSPVFVGEILVIHSNIVSNMIINVINMDVINM